MPTTAELLIESLKECGVSVIFANLGSDHPALIEALATARERGVDTPAVVIAPHEMCALSAAHGYALATGEAQAVFVHTDVGTANLGGSVHNAARSKVPVFIFAGLTPYTLEGELPGTRNTWVNNTQEVRDQQSLVRPYAKWSYDIRTGLNVKQVVHRAMQLAKSSPQGPVYLSGAREVLAEVVKRPKLSPTRWNPVAPIPAPKDLIRRLGADLAGAEHPLIITSHLGRNIAAVPKLVELAERLGVGVVETIHTHVNFPADHPLHLGYSAEHLIADADVVVVIDADSPWIPAVSAPSEDAVVYFVDADPLKEDLPLWYMPSDYFIRTDSEIFLEQLLQEMPAVDIDPSKVRARTQRFEPIHRAQRDSWEKQLEQLPQDKITAEHVSLALSRLIDEETIIVNESGTNKEKVFKHLGRNRPGTLFGNRGSSLGWSGGAAIGIKMAAPSRNVVRIVGDGSYFFSIPSATYWMAEQYDTPFLTVILDNGGWNATKRNLQLQYPGGVADRTDRLWVNLGQSADLAGIAAAAGGAYAVRINKIGELETGLKEALDKVATGRSAVVAVSLEPISLQAWEHQ